MRGRQPIITKIFWKRTYLFIEYESNVDIELSIVQLKKNKRNREDYIIEEHRLETKLLEKNKYRSKINITIAEGREILKPGNWILIINGDIYNRPIIEDKVLFNIEDISRVFRYGQKFYAYIVTFHIRKRIDEITGEEIISLGFFSNYMKKNKRYKKRNLISAFEERKTIKGFIRKSAFVMAKWGFNLYYQLVSHLTPKTGKRVLLMSENRVKIMDNLESIDNRLKERNLDEQFKITYSFRNIFDRRQNPIEWLSLLTKIAMQDFIFVDDYVPIFNFLNIHKKTTIIQVWHAGFGFKLVGYGRFGIDGSPYPTASCHRKYTYGLVGNDNLREIYSEVWGIEKKALLATGMPRLEHFLDKNNIKTARARLYKEFPNLKNRTVITFAPTYRGASQATAYNDFTKVDFDYLYKYCKKTNSAVIVSTHHFIRDKFPIKDEYKDLIFDMSNQKLHDVFYVTDIFVTDYSSSFYDFMLLNKPIIFYVYDKALYSATRGVHRPIDDVAPGKVCHTFEEVMAAIKKKDFAGNKPAEFLRDKCLTNKMLASDQVIDYVLLHKTVEGICEE